MNVRQLREICQGRLDDEVKGYLIPPSLFLEYLNEAEEEACVRANLIFDKTSTFCTIAVTAGTSVYTLDDSIYSIRYASFTGSDGVPSKLIIEDKDYLDDRYPNWRTTTDKPVWLMHEESFVELAYTPSENGTLKIEVYRLPTNEMTGDGSSPEINRVHHRGLLYWVLHRIYGNPDIDVLNPGESQRNEHEFIKLFGQRPMATRRRKQAISNPHRNKLSFI